MDKNKNGLSRYIPSHIKATIRRNAGFGCVFCGCVLVEYEHIEPEFNSAFEHDPEKMTILCPLHHDRVTKKIISKLQVWEARSKPKGLIQGYVNDFLYSKTNNLEFCIGNMSTTNMGIVVSVYGKPLFWFEASEKIEEPFTICSVFYGRDGFPIAYINRNEYIAIVGNQDIVSEGTKLTVTDKKIGCILEIHRAGDEAIHIRKLYQQYRNIKIIVKDENKPILFGEINETDDNLSSIGGLSLVGQGIESKAIGIGRIPSFETGNRIQNIIQSIMNGDRVFDCIGNHKGWITNNNLVNLRGLIVGFVVDNKAYDITGEYVCNYTSGSLFYQTDSYETGEPIFIINDNKKGSSIRKNKDYDLSYRFFDFS